MEMEIIKDNNTKNSKEACFFTVTSMNLENCSVGRAEKVFNGTTSDYPDIPVDIRRLGKVEFYDDEERAKNALKRHYLKSTEIDLLAKTYALESEKLESQSIRFDLRFIDKSDPLNKLEISKLKGLLASKKENALKLRKEISILRHYRNSKIEISDKFNF